MYCISQMLLHWKMHVRQIKEHVFCASRFVTLKNVYMVLDGSQIVTCLPLRSQKIALPSDCGTSHICNKTCCPECKKVSLDFEGVTNVDFAQTSADDLSAWTTEFDSVMMSFVLMFVPDKAKALQEVALQG